jgi:hypothetical protein
LPSSSFLYGGLPAGLALAGDAMKVSAGVRLDGMFPL